MESKLTQLGRQAILAASQHLDTRERVCAFLAHSRMMVAFYQAGQQRRLVARRR
jgi:hypothetical protein